MPPSRPSIALTAGALMLGSLTALALPAPATAQFDDTAPTIEITVPPSTHDVWYTDSVTLDVAVSDGVGVGVREVDYLLTGASAGAGPLSTDGGTIPITVEGHTTVYVTAFDHADNRGHEVFKVGIDRTPPIITVSSPTSGATIEQGTTTPVHFDCTDDDSGLAACTGPVLLDTTTLGRHEVVLTARDRVGHIQTRTVTYDVVPPATATPVESTVSATARSRRAGTVVLNVSVDARSVPAAGKVVVLRRGRAVGTGRVDDAGNLRIVLRGQAAGRTTYVVKYRGNPAVASASDRVRVNVRGR